MVLTIKVTQYQGKTPESPIEAAFDENGGSLGRSPKNHLVLSDKKNYISTKHADITYENGRFYYMDSSLNGTQIIKYHPDEPQKTITLKKEDKIELQNRDELQVGDYRMLLTISGDDEGDDGDLDGPSVSHPNKLSLTAFGFIRDDDAGHHVKEQPKPETGSESVHGHSPLSVDSVDDIDPFFPHQDRMEYRSTEDVPNELSKSPIDLNYSDFFSQDHQKQRDSVKSVVVNDGQMETGPHLKADEPYPNEELPSKIKPVADSTDQMEAESLPDFLEAFFNAAGIHDTSALLSETNAELAHNLGMVFRELVGGLMMILRGRTELKSHLRLVMTTLKSSENNPLKFFPTVDDVLIYLLTKNHPGYIEASDAVREGFGDIMGHQLALNAGVQVSLANILKRFDPTHIAHKFDEGIVLNKKAKCWDEYRKAYPQIAEKALEDFFGEDFVRAYENQIQKLRTDPKQT